MSPLLRRWPTIVAVIALCLNVDFVIMPVLAMFGVHGWVLFWTAAFFATAEPCYWNWYSKWVVRNVKRTDRARRIARHFEAENLGDQLRAFWEDKFDWFVEHAREREEGNGRDHIRAQSFVRFIKATHVVMVYPTMMFLGFSFAGWTVAIFLQRIQPVPGGFALFLVANAIKTWLIGIAFLALPWWGKLLVIMGGLAFIAFSTRKIVMNVSELKSSGGDEHTPDGRPE